MKSREIDIFLATYQAAPLSAEIGDLAYNLMKTYSKSNLMAWIPATP